MTGFTRTWRLGTLTRRMPRILYYVGCSVLAFLFVFPLLWTVITAFKPSIEASASPTTFLPTHISFDNFKALANYGDNFGVYVWNSAVVALGTVAVTAVLSILAGYGFARFHFRGKNILFVVILSTLMIPFQSILIPLFLVLRALHLDNTLLGLCLVYVTFQLPFGIFVMRNAFAVVPREIEESALMDGCTPLTLLGRVLLPLVRPGIVTVAIFAFLNSWNEFLAALIFISDSDKYTLPVQLINVQSGYLGTVDWGAIQAGVTITMLPCLVIFLVLQRYYVQGIAAGAVKG